MLTLYLIALAIGGTLILVSLAFGGHDADVDVDADADVDVDADVDTELDAGHGIDFSGADFWIPFASVRFWIFFTAFFGLAGTLLSTVGSMSAQMVVGGAALGTGYVCGVAASAAFKWMKKHESDSSVRMTDMAGVRGKVLLAIRKGETGKIRVSLKGQVLDAMATTEDDAEYPIGSEVMVYDTREDGELVVTKADAEPV